MTLTRRQWLMGLAINGVLAVPASLYPVRGDYLLSQWLPTYLFTLATATTFLYCVARASERSVSVWSVLLSAAVMAAFAPLSATSCIYRLQADAALLAFVLAMACALSTNRLVSWWGGLAGIAVASGLDATALLWPIGGLWMALVHGRSKTFFSLALGVAVLATVLSGWLDGRFLTTYRIREVGYLLHRDLRLLMPVLLLGLAGYARLGVRSDKAAKIRQPWWLAGVAATSLLALLLVVFAVRLNVRIALVGLWCFAPAALGEMVEMIRARSDRSYLMRGVGLLSAMLCAALAWPAAYEWWSNLMVLVFVLVPGA